MNYAAGRSDLSAGPFTENRASVGNQFLINNQQQNRFAVLYSTRILKTSSTENFLQENL